MYWQNTHNVGYQYVDLFISVSNKNDLFYFPLYKCTFFFGGGGRGGKIYIPEIIVVLWLKVL